MRDMQNKSNRQIKGEEKIFQHTKLIKKKKKNMNRGYIQTIQQKGYSTGELI